VIEIVRSVTQNKTGASRFETALSVSAWFYFCVLWLCLALRLVFKDRWWWLGFLNTLTPYWFAPLPVVLPIAYFTKRRVLWTQALLGVVVFLSLFGELWLPQWRLSDSDDPTLVVMSYNILGTNQNWPAMRDSILDSQADVVSLQELNREVAQTIEAEFSERYPYQILDFQDSLISRYPITLTEATLPDSWGTPPQVYQLDFDGQLVTLVNAHFYASFLNFDVPFMTWVFREREHQAQLLADFASRIDTPLIVTIDFNATDQNQAYRIITGQLIDSWREAGWGFGHTFPGGPSAPSLRRPVVAGRPIPMWVFRIDYIFHSNDFLATKARLGKWDGVSDHRPVIATLEMEQ
jgi:endonuclease/exonuclease/phosphatase (EEP) superfamily protein YafD